MSGIRPPHLVAAHEGVGCAKTRMPHDTPLIATIVAGLGLAFVFGTIAHRLKIPPLVGYLLAGVAVGPFTPGYVADQALATELAELGIILLMFGVGLHFSLKDLLSVKAIAIPGAIVQIAVATLMGLGLAMLMEWKVSEGLVFGLALSVASTVVLLRALQERRLMETGRGRIAVGWLIVEDLAMVLALVLIPAFANLQMGTPPQRLPAGRPFRSRALGRIAADGRQGRPVHRADADRGTTADPVDPSLHRAHRIARAVPARRAGDRAGRRIRIDQTVRRVAGAGRVLCRDDAAGSRRSVSAPRRNRCRCAMPLPCCSSCRSECCSTRSAWSATRGR